MTDKAETLASNTTAAGGLQGCAREKYWSEKTPDERMRTLAENLAAVMILNEQLRERVVRLERHAHGPDGGMVVPFRERDHDDYDYRGKASHDRIYERLGLREPRG